ARIASATVGVDVSQARPEIERPIHQPVEHAIAPVETEQAPVLADIDLIAHPPIAAELLVVIAAEVLVVIAAEVLRGGWQGHSGERYGGQGGGEQFVFHLEKLP